MPSLTINRRSFDLSGLPPHRSVLDFLRENRLTGTKCGCNEGDCGACTILLLESNRSPRAINACITPALSLAGREILTAEGLKGSTGVPPVNPGSPPPSSPLHPVQQAMVTHHGSQRSTGVPPVNPGSPPPSPPLNPVQQAMVTPHGSQRSTGVPPVNPGSPPPSPPLHPVQQAMVDHHGSQCGYCTPGFICSMAEAADRGITTDPAKLADQLCGNLCRCTGYRPIQTAATSLPSSLERGLQPASSSLTTDHCSLGTSTFHAPTTLADALALKADHPTAPFLAGATELGVLFNKRALRPDALISLDHIAELKQIEKTDTHWRIGAGAPLTDVEDALAGEYPILDELWPQFASRQIRHRATLGGNLATASPIGDTAPALLALDASLTLVSATGTRSIPLSDFFIAYRKTQLLPEELILTIDIPREQKGTARFFKVARRRELDISIVAAAIRIATDSDGRITEARLAYGGVAPTPIRARKTESALLNLPASEATSETILTLLATEFAPISDTRATAAYRHHLIRDLFLKFFVERRSPDRHSTSPRLPLSPLSFPLSPPAKRPSTPHESAERHVTGAALYTQDHALRRRTLHVHCVRSTVARGLLETLDTSRAAASPGVVTILTAHDIPGSNNTGCSAHDEPLFAESGIDFHGQLVAAVVAETPEQARIAASLIEVKFTALPPIIGIPAALEAQSFHTTPHTLARGEVDRALAESPHLLEGTLDIGGQEQFYLETQAALAEPDGEGGILVTSSTQHPTETQTIVAEVLGLHRHQVVVECPRMGGGFGGKESQANPVAALCALAAIKTGEPVSLQLDRDEDMATTGKRHPFHAIYKVGYGSDGLLHAADVRLYSDGGWSLDLSLPVNDRALFHLDNAYYIPHVRFRGQVCKTNVTSHTAFRGFGGPQGMVVIEEIIARVAEKTGLPPEEVRRKNFYHGSGETNTTHYGEDLGDNRLERIWTELLQSSEFQQRRAQIDDFNQSNPHHKRGLAITPVKFGISFTLKHYNQAGALVLIYADGSVQVNHGGTEMGQGLHTKILSVARRELTLPADSIRLMHTRTDKVPNTSATAASSGSDLNGMAVADACRTLRQRLTDVAAGNLGVDPNDVTLTDGIFRTSSGESLTFAETAALAYMQRVQLSATGYYKTPGLQWDWSQPNPKGRPFHYFAFGAAVTEVEVDGFTGMHRILRTDILHDVGDSLNPATDIGQIEGGYVQGAGWLTSEELKWAEHGHLLTHSASTYAIPAWSDAPADFRVSLLTDATQENTIHGSKAVGEPPLMLAISVREALRDAIHAFGKTETDLQSPLTGEVIKHAIGPMRPS
ncbi:xanthine dehydrogenase molybdopterin binding subunit [Haloferula sargassicola]|uniref:Xanthine dehydrogenase n=1 Tax=Haloferula sargassicola TaxID=490096 RepID=A0ABP9UX16_9BACT